MCNSHRSADITQGSIGVVPTVSRKGIKQPIYYNLSLLLALLYVYEYRSVLYYNVRHVKAIGKRNRISRTRAAVSFVARVTLELRDTAGDRSSRHDGFINSPERNEQKGNERSPIHPHARGKPIPICSLLIAHTLSLSFFRIK